MAISLRIEKLCQRNSLNANNVGNFVRFLRLRVLAHLTPVKKSVHMCEDCSKRFETVSYEPETVFKDTWP